MNTSVCHPERSENLLVEIDFERFPADGFDRTSDPVDVDPVFPAITRVEYQRLPSAEKPAASSSVESAKLG
jgi:hypothetical protein